ncbi:MAG TPA: 30S ribosomal protein S5, partial [Patescibacteria group bacterium]|nr:30S ribosomal protein S5 [Patescibacteria group bacterium]
MVEEHKAQEKTKEKPAITQGQSVQAPGGKERPEQKQRSFDRSMQRGGGRQRKGRKKREEKPKEEFESTIIDLARVTRVMAGGKRMSFRACVVIGDKKGRVGMGVAKGTDVQLAVAKATEQAKKSIIHVKIVNGTIPHRVEQKFKGAVVLLKPAKLGIGVIAGGPVRIVMEFAGVKNIVAKMKGAGNKISNVSAV